MHPRAQELFEELCDLSQESREKRLSKIAEEDVVLADEVRSLLKSYENAGEFLADATANFDQQDIDPEDIQFVSITEKPGDTIGRYKLLEQIGAGGFGQVFMAQQSEPVRRRVALKIIKLGMDTGQALARFEAERQALAMMDHPNIAKVYDGGATETGRPYFVMELVRGEAITDYCDRSRMPMKERLQLFRQVCNAIEHAHQKGIVHRDIKPSNVLVTVSDDKPLVKVIDFGIAKALNTELTEKTLFTEFRQLIGTPQYMSPEQAERSGVDIDTRSDIYSLGVLLYEILTGATPVDPKRLESAAWGQWQKMISEEEPKRPSDHVSSTMETLEDVAGHRSVAAKDLAGTLRGDLDWIVLKSLEKDRARRYSTASQFADDIDRYLSDQVVLATPPDKMYVFNRFLRRNRNTVLFAGLLLATLLAGLIGTSAAAIWATNEREAAIVERRKADESRQLAEESTSRVQRMAALAFSPFLGPEDVTQLADEARADVEALQQRVSSSDPMLVRLECQYVTLLATHAQRQNNLEGLKRALKAAEELLPRAVEALPKKDANRLALLNTTIQLNMNQNSDPEHIAKLYGRLISLMKLIHGNRTASLLMPEYAVQLSKVKWHQAVEKTIDEYLELVKGEALPAAEFARLNAAVDDLAAWGVAHKPTYNRLLAFRDAGIVSATKEYDDEELAADQQAMQGEWATRDKDDPNVVVEMKIEGDRGDVEIKGPKGNVVTRRSARFVLSRSGPLRLMTIYREGTQPENGDSYVYKLKGDSLFHAHGMMREGHNVAEPRMDVWKRTK